MGSRIARLLLEWLRTAGSELSDLTLVDGILQSAMAAFGDEGYRATLLLLARNCPGLRRLKIYRGEDVPWDQNISVAVDILRIVGPRLHSLSATDSYSIYIAKYCTALRSLALDIGSLRRDIGSVLRGVGSTLETFETTSSYFGSEFSPLANEDIQLLQELCAKLSRVLVYVRPEAQPAYAELLCSYGAQLRYALIGGMRKALCAKGISECPNMRATFRLFADNSFVDALQVLASSVDKIVIEIDGNSMNGKDVAIAVSTYVYVKSIEVHAGCATQAASVIVRKATVAAYAILRFEKPVLRSFYLGIEVIESDAGTIGDGFQEFGRRVANLREFSYAGPFPEKGAFQEIIRDAPILEKVLLDLSSDEEGVLWDLDERAENAAETFEECKKLFSLCICIDWDSDIRQETLKNKWRSSRFRTGKAADLSVEFQSEF